MKKIFLLLTLFYILLLNSCEDNPIYNDNTTPGRRDYVWTMDTLETYANRIQSIWGSSPDDVWAVGLGGLTAYDGVWQFDGITWRTHSQALSIAPECIYGFAQNDIWMGGNDGKIFHFNGSSWSQRFMIERQDTIGNWINYIWGKNPNDIYALGRAPVNQERFTRSFILHFDGINWKEIYFSKKQLQFFFIQEENSQVFLSGIILTGTIEPDTVFFAKLVNNDVKEIYRNTMDKITFANLCQIGDKTYFLIGQDLCRYIKGGFKKVISFNESMFGYAAFGRNEKDIFIRMQDGLAHYNGKDLEYLYHFSSNWVSILNKPMFFDNDVFFTIHDNLYDYNLILRGKLNN